MSWSIKSPAPPADYVYGPLYRPSWASVARGVIAILRGRSQSLARDALYAIADMPAPPLVRGLDLIPPQGPFAVAANHYERPGMWMVWPALFLAHLIRERTGQDMHYVAIETWEGFSVGDIVVPRTAVQVVFERAFRVYGILAMASPDAPAGARARSIRLARATIRDGAIIGIMPEGDVGPTPELIEPPEGAGAFLRLLHVPILPVGLFEEAGHLVAQIGEPLRLDMLPDVPKADRDQQATRRVMEAIRDLLPEPLWGAYRSR